MLYLNLCDTCAQCFGNCSGNPEFPADGKNGDDNVIACDGYARDEKKVDTFMVGDGSKEINDAFDQHVETFIDKNGNIIASSSGTESLVVNLNKEQTKRLNELGFFKLKVSEIATLEAARKLAYDRGRYALHRDLDALIKKLSKE